MLMAMVFLMFCLFIGGSVLAAATANGSRMAHMVSDQQEYLSQRSALAVIAEMITPQEGNVLRISFKPVQNRIDVEIPATNWNGNTIPALQKILYDIVTDHYYDSSHNLRYSVPGWSPTFGRNTQGTIQITFDEETQDATYAVTFQQEGSAEKTCVLEVQFPDNPRVRLVMTGNINIANSQITISWSLPSIQKGGA